MNGFYITASKTSRRLALTLLICATIGAIACASGTPPLLVAIRTSPDSVRLSINPEGASFSLSAIVRNDNVRPVYITGCNPAAERDINGVWKTVFSPACLADQHWQIPAGDTLVIPVLLYGYTADGMFPQLDVPATSGTYRLVFSVSLGDARSDGTALTSPGPPRRVVSSPFVLTN